MTALYIALGIAAWAACGWLAYRRLISHFQREFRRAARDMYWADVQFATLIAMTGPFGFIGSVAICRHGIAYVPPPGQRDEATF